MARMYPDRVRLETKSAAERRLYERFRDTLPRDYTVFHSVAWQTRDRRRGAQDGEADFIVAHPTKGLLLIEVKGGRIEYDGVSDQWFSNGTRLKKDPFVQARDNMYSLLDKVEDLPAWDLGDLSMGHAVAFPDCQAPGDLRLDAPRDIILDYDNLDDVHGWVDRVLAHYRRGSAGFREPGEAVIEALVDLLAPRIELRLPLARQAEADAEVVARLSEEQYDLLDSFSERRRMAISGCAGSGKTTMAVEQARRLGRQGFRVLLTCFNRNLAQHLRADAGLPQGVDVQHFHGLCYDLARRAGLEKRLQGQWTPQERNQVVLPGLLLDAIDALGPQYDAVLVDEGQDFEPDWWLHLQCLLRDTKDGIFYIFYDDNQNLYRPAFALPADMDRFPLTRNYRNTQRIHHTFLPFYRGTRQPVARGPEGRPPEIRFYTTKADLGKALRQVLYRLVEEEEFDTDDIVVLTPYDREKTAVWELGPLGNFRLTDKEQHGSSEVYWSTIHSFKGLERPVVILADVYARQHGDLATLLYVGCSRARNHLVILAHTELPDAIRTRLQPA